MVNIPTDLEVLQYAAKFNSNPVQMMTRRTAQEVECPFCHAAPGLPCSGSNGRIRNAQHKDRYFERVRRFILEGHCA